MHTFFPSTVSLSRARSLAVFYLFRAYGTMAPKMCSHKQFLNVFGMNKTHSVQNQRSQMMTTPKPEINEQNTYYEIRKKNYELTFSHLVKLSKCNAL